MGFVGREMRVLAPVAKSGYNTTMVATGAAVATGPCVGASNAGYYGTAIPITVGSTGTRGFATDEAGTVFQDTTGVAPVQPFTVAGTVSAIQ